MDYAKERVVAEVGKKPREGSLVVVDYSKPSSEKRMTVVDLKTGRAKMNSLVAHGVNSGLLYATEFSDRVGSNQSSLGLYKVGEEYYGKHGRSLRLDGLDPGFNINARRRAIVVHAADYVSHEAMQANRHEFGRLGRSAGCLSLSDEDMERLDKKLKRPAYIFAYAPTMVAEHEYPDPVRSPANRTIRPMLASTKPADKPAIARPDGTASPRSGGGEGEMVLIASIDGTSDEPTSPTAAAAAAPAAVDAGEESALEAGGASEESVESNGPVSGVGRGLVGVAGAASRSLVSTVSRVNFIPNWN